MDPHYTYTILKEEDGSAILDFESFPEIVCEITPADIQQNKVASIAVDAVRNALKARIDYQDDIPNSDSKPGPPDSRTVTLTPLDTLKISLYKTMRESNCSRAEFAKRAMVTPTGLNRALDLFHASRFDVLIDMFDQLGYSVASTVSVTRTQVAS